MKYKEVFFIWLLADAFLAIGLFGFVIYEQFTGADKNDLGMFLQLAGYGICISLPSLIAMLLFNWVYNANAKAGADRRLAFIALVICINMLYLLIGEYGIGMTGEFNYFYIASTMAGLLSFYLVDRTAGKKMLSV